MKKVIYFLILFSYLNIPELISDPRWITLTNFPQISARVDDLFFVNLYTGWAVAGQGQVYKTTDGGMNWQQEFQPVGNSWLRCVGFVDSLTGFIGVYDSTFGQAALLKTTNGGSNWLKVTNISAPKPKGLCGICVVKNTNVVYACGRIEGPAILIKSTDAGNTWININMSAYASRFVDCYFSSPDSGFVVGGQGDPYAQTKAVILFTSDGGSSWVYRVNSPRINESFWKISFSSSLNGAASLNIQEDSLFFFKTSDGGINWQRMGFPLASGNYFTQGIGFVNANTGWLGGDFISLATYQTTDGGSTWTPNNFGRTLNRIRFLNDSIGYACGTGMYKYTTELIGVISNNNEIPQIFDLKQNFPNPFNPNTTIQYDIPVGSFLKIEIFNSLGQRIKVVYEGFESAGKYTARWDGTNFAREELSSGLYFYKLTAGENVVTRKMVLLR